MTSTQKRWPDFLIIGAQKAGTTALYHFLGQHPDIFLPRLKEPHFFSYEVETRRFVGVERNGRTVDDLDTYLRLFAGVEERQVAGEASPSYLYMPTSAERIHHHAPNVKLIAILRQPIDRAYSNYLHAVRDGRESISDFESALAAEAERTAQGWGPMWHYLAKGHYPQQLEAYRKRFRSEQFLIRLYDDLIEDMPATLGEVFTFLGVDDGFAPDTRARHNTSRIPGNAITKRMSSLYGALPEQLRERLLPSPVRHFVRDRMFRRPPKLDETLRIELTDRYFRKEITELSELLQRDLSSWLGPR